MFAHAGHSYSLARWPGAGPVIVALHGFTGSGQDFESLAETMPEYDWWAPDLPGHGDTSPLLSDGPWMPEICQAVAALIEACPADRPLFLLGYSMGGRVALQTLAHTPAVHRVARAVIVSATPGLEDPEAHAQRRLWDRALAEQIRHQGTASFLESWQRTPLIATQACIEAGPLKRMKSRRRSLDAQALALAAERLGTGAMVCWGALDTLRQPLLVLTGALDSKYGEIAEAMLQRLPNGVHTILEEAGHCCHLEAPNEAS